MEAEEGLFRRVGVEVARSRGALSSVAAPVNKGGWFSKASSILYDILHLPRLSRYLPFPSPSEVRKWAGRTTGPWRNADCSVGRVGCTRNSRPGSSCHGGTRGGWLDEQGSWEGEGKWSGGEGRSIGCGYDHTFRPCTHAHIACSTISRSHLRNSCMASRATVLSLNIYIKLPAIESFLSLVIE